jgi:predicted PurR-regulated permease PerM
MEEEYFRKIMTSVILLSLIVLSFFLLKPILLSIIFGIILAFIFTPIYNLIYKKTNSTNFSATVTSLVLILIIAVPILFLTPVIIDQFFKFYFALQQIDIIQSFKEIFPRLSSEGFLEILKSIADSSMNKIINFIANSLTINNLVNFFLKSIVVFFTFFFVLRDKEKISTYIKSLLPFSKDVENKLFESSKAITSSVIYGQVVIGILQGLAVGISFFIFKVPNALFLTILAILAGIFPIIGTTIIWAPVVIYLFVAGSTFSAIGVIFFGLISNVMDNFLRPIIVSKKTRINSSIVLIGMIGGIFLFGVLGIIIGPLILAYLLILLELYRNKKTSGLLIKTE